jgi:CAAX prenyl protease-like protein
MSELESLSARTASVEPGGFGLDPRDDPGTLAWGSRSAVSATRHRVSVETVEVGFLFAFLFSYIWMIGQTSLAGSWPAFALFFGFTCLSHCLHGDTRRDLGLRLDTFRRALSEAITVVAPALLLAVGAGFLLEGGGPADPASVVLSLVRLYPWALFQQYGLQCFFGRRLRGVLGDGIRHDIACAAIFAALHLPNPFLTVVTFGAAYCFCVLFRRCPNLFALALAHAVSSSVLYHVLPPGINCMMRVGPGCLALLGLD